MKRIYLIDCPGVVPPSQGDNEEDILLRGVVRVENVEHPAQYIDAVLRRAQTKHIERTYEIKEADYGGDSIEFLSILARKAGRLLKGGEPDVDGVAKMVLNDFLRGKIPWFTPPPKKRKDADEDGEAKEVVEGRKRQLGEMPGAKKVFVPASDSVTEQIEAEDGPEDDSESDSEAPALSAGDELDEDDEDDGNDEDNDAAEVSESYAEEEGEDGQNGVKLV